MLHLANDIHQCSLVAKSAVKVYRVLSKSDKGSTEIALLRRVKDLTAQKMDIQIDRQDRLNLASQNEQQLKT